MKRGRKENCNLRSVDECWIGFCSDGGRQNYLASHQVSGIQGHIRIHAPVFNFPEKFKYVDFLKVHQAQGCEFDAVIIPIDTQHFQMLFRNLIYTGLTRAKQLCVFIGSRKAPVKQIDNRKRQTALSILL